MTVSDDSISYFSFEQYPVDRKGRCTEGGRTEGPSRLARQIRLSDGQKNIRSHWNHFLFNRAVYAYSCKSRTATGRYTHGIAHIHLKLRSYVFYCWTTWVSSLASELLVATIGREGGFQLDHMTKSPDHSFVPPVVWVGVLYAYGTLPHTFKILKVNLKSR